MASTKELRALITLAGKIDPSLQTAMMKATKMNLNMVQESKKSAGSMNKVWTIAKGVFTGNLMTKGLSMVTNGIRAVGSQGIQLASDLTEVQNVVDTTFGEGSKQIDEWSGKALNAFGLSELQAKKFTGTLGAMLKSSGISSQYLVKMSEGVVGLSGDFASFYNLDQEEAFQKIRSGISGETEPLKQLGINMSVANLQAFAMSKGITTSYDKMDQASQTLLRYNYLMEVSKDAQGDFAKTLDTSYANQKKLLTTNLSQKMAGLWHKSLPMITKGIQFLNNAVSGIDVDAVGDKISNGLGTAFNLISQYGPVVIGTLKKIPPIIGQVYDKGKTAIGFVVNNWPIIGPILAGLTTSAGLFATKLLVIPKVMSTIPKAIGGVKTAMGTIKTVGTLLTSPFGLTVLAIGALVGAGIWLYKNWDWISKGIVGVWQNKVMPFFSGIGAWFTGVWGKVVDGFKFAWGGVTSWFKGLWDGVVGIFKGYLNIYVGMFNFVLGALNKVQFDVPDWVPLLGGKHVGINIPLIPKFAQGGFTDRPSIFGEAGPEAAIPIKYKNQRSISILNQTAKAIGASPTGGGMPPISLTFNFNGPVSNKEEVTSGVREAEDYIIDILEKYLGGRPSFG